MSNFLYRDKRVTIYPTLLVINKYYFPLATSKTIMFDQIQSVSLLNADQVNHQWGPSKAYLNDWFPLDTERKDKHKFIELKLKGEKIRPAFTPEEPEIAFNIIWQHHTKEGQQYLKKVQQGKENTHNFTDILHESVPKKHDSDNIKIKQSQNTMVLRDQPLGEKRSSNI